ncbi:MAG TPA: hypothetical protein DCM87_18850 [Planctomycetes bacterium]|nr:hypothetical protein [Planctomycetota bacterium]
MGRAAPRPRVRRASARVRATVVIAAHNEGDLLARTVRACLATAPSCELEIIVADDASTDGSVADVERRFPRVRIVGHRRRTGVAATKDLGARRAKGDVLVFLDGHCKPERGALERLVLDVECFQGDAVVMPRIAALDERTWCNSRRCTGAAFGLDPATLDGFWADAGEMRRWGPFVESPAFIGCCAAVGRRLYRKLRGFDRDMVEWGLEDLDFGLKAWLMGHPVVSDVSVTIGHRFRRAFTTYAVAHESVLANKLRMARRHLGEAHWRRWAARVRGQEPADVWRRAWKLFSLRRASVEADRRYFMARRVHDEFWWAEHCGAVWPDGPARRG